MKPAILRVLVLGALAMGLPLSASAQTFLFNFGANAVTDDLSGQVWNQVNAAATATVGSAGATKAGLLDTSGATTGSSLVMLSRFNGLNTAGTQVSTVFPPSATRDSFYGNTASFNGFENIFPSFKVTGLASGVSYAVSLYASRTGGTENRETKYTVVGATTEIVLLNAADNLDGLAAVPDMKPAANGEITISLAPGDSNNTAQRFTYLGVLKIASASTAVPVGFSAEPADTTVLQARPVRFTASVTGTPPYTLQWLLNNQPILDATGFTYDIPGAALSLNGGLYSVRVSNATSTLTSRQALLTVTPDTAAPTLVSVASQGPAAISILFSEEMDAASVTEVANYSLDGGALTLSSATLQADRKTVVLTPLERLPASVVLQFGVLMDIAGNAFVSTANSEIVVPQPDGESFLFDFGDNLTTTEAGPAPEDPLYVWNNIPVNQANSDGTVLGGLRKNDGTNTDLNFTVVSRFNGSNTSGTTESAVWAVEASRDSLFGNTELFNTLENVAPVFKITGLPPGQVCDLLFYASRMGVSDNRETVYTVTGETTGTASLNASNNVEGTTSVNGIKASASGEISIALTPGASNNNSNHFTYLNVLKLTVRGAGESNPLLTPVLADGIVTIQWSGPGVLESATALSGPWAPVGGAVSPYFEVVNGARKFFRLRITPVAP